jgi:hypothetical protein
MAGAFSRYQLDAQGQAASPARWLALGAVVVALLAVFVLRTSVARVAGAPRLPDLFHLAIVLGSALVLFTSYRSLTRLDWLVGLGLGFLLGLQLPFTTLFSPYPFFDLDLGEWGEAFVRGASTAVAALGGLSIARRGGPVQLRLAAGDWRRSAASFVFGVLVGVPLAVLNMFANAWTQGRAFVWQSPLSAALDALQPAVFEEILYRLALLGLIWFVLQRTWPSRQAAWLAGALSLLVHTYVVHFGDEFITQPLPTLATGAVMGLIWGLPLTVLALRRDLDSATGFHWVQDFARFWAGL